MLNFSVGLGGRALFGEWESDGGREDEQLRLSL